VQTTVARPAVARVLATGAVTGALALLAAFSFGVLMLATMVAWWIPLVALALLAGWPLLWNIGHLASSSRAAHIAATTPVAIAVPVLVLLGVDLGRASTALTGGRARARRHRRRRSRLRLPVLGWQGRAASP
jgi:hypothetical protein